MRILAVLALTAACHKTDPLYCVDHPDDQTNCGAADAGPPDVPVGTICFGPATAPFQVCLDEMPTRDVLLPIVLDTDTDPFCLDAAHQPVAWKAMTDACIVAAVTITSNTTATSVKGKRPLVLLATQTIAISQPLLAASFRVTAALGPNANPTDCSGGTDGMFGILGASGGGGGASFQTLGGAGGTGNNATSPAGTPTATGIPSRLRGGCTGTNGGGPTGAVGAPGAGGGAVYLVAGVSITVTSTINASASAAGGNGAAAGSGGGSGGMIALFAPMITATTGMIFANGGGGSGGGDGTSPGASGSDPATALDQANGGAKGGGGGGDGGKGYGNVTDATAGQSVSRGGGGGGGGAGYILSNVALGPMTSPPRRGF